MLILIVDDDAGTRAILARALERAGHTAVAAADGACALAAFAAARPDLILLDVELPDVDGFEVCRRIRRDDRVPIILLTARRAEEDVLRGFDLGVDDYITKPFSPRVVVARVGGILRRAAERDRRERADRPRVGAFEVDVEDHEIRRGNMSVRLTPLEARLLHVLAVNAGRTVPYGSLIQQGWRGERTGLANLKLQVHRIRRKLEDLDPGAVAIRATAGTGYRLTANPCPESVERAGA